jgi:hypothetical protein
MEQLASFDIIWNMLTEALIKESNINQTAPGQFPPEKYRCDTAALGGLGRTFGGGEGFTAARRVQRCLENRVDFKMKNGKSVENTWDIIRFIFVFIYIYITKGFQH